MMRLILVTLGAAAALRGFDDQATGKDYEATRGAPNPACSMCNLEHAVAYQECVTKWGGDPCNDDKDGAGGECCHTKKKHDTCMTCKGEDCENCNNVYYTKFADTYGAQAKESADKKANQEAIDKAFR